MDGMAAVGRTTPAPAGQVIEYELSWPGAPKMLMPMADMATMAADPFACCLPGGGSTHELVYDRNGGGSVFWVSGQMYDHIARIELDGSATYFEMPKGSLPHGMAYDQQGRLWVTFEGLGQLARIDPDGSVAETLDIAIYAKEVKGAFNPRPHGLGIGSDGALWFTGKLSNTIGRVDAARKVQHFVLPTIGTVPIYISAGPDGNMWCTELGSSTIARITPEGVVSEFPIPGNSRPIAIVRGPDGKSMWFSEEAGGKLGRIDMDGHITEFPVPLTHRDAILAGLAFDARGNLWVQQYISPPAFGPTGDDYIVRLDSALTMAPAGDLSNVAVNYYKAPSQRTVMHRITQGPDGNIWFSELGLNRIGKLVL
jgi:virginiamycin B lyase